MAGKDELVFGFATQYQFATLVLVAIVLFALYRIGKQLKWF